MNYRGKASYLDKPSKDYAISLLNKYSSNDIDEYAILIKDYTIINGSGTKHKFNEVHKCDNIYYILNNGTYAGFIEANIDSPSNWIGKGFINPVKIYNAYRVDTDADSVRVYIPKSELKYSNNLRFVFQYDSDSYREYGASVTDTIGNEFITTEIRNTYNSSYTFTVFYGK